MLIRRITVIFLPLLLGALEARAVPNYWNCDNRVGGRWVWGQAPSACDVDPFGSGGFVTAHYPQLIFPAANAGSVETDRYMNQAHAALRDAARHYLLQREPRAGAQLIAEWGHLVLATAHQESFWSHYRTAADGRLKMMRGDLGHGHGMMQVDDRSHQAALLNGKGWNFGPHLSYAFDILYHEWTSALSRSCVSDGRSRARSAYSAYNGGPGSGCRWTDPGSAFGANDRNFLEKYDGQLWLEHVANPTVPSSTDIGCLMEEGSDCAGATPGSGNGSGAGAPSPSLHALYRQDDSHLCVFDGSGFSCAERRDEPCLRAKFGLPASAAPVAPDAAWARDFVSRTPDRRELCLAAEPRLARIGEWLEASQAIHFRDTPGGAILGLVPQGAAVQVLDFELGADGVFYYRANVDSLLGYFAGGIRKRGTLFAAPLSGVPPSSEAQIPGPGARIRVVIPSGLNLRDSIGGAILATLPPGSTAEIRQVFIHGAESFVYYQVQSELGMGFIYSGHLLPEPTLSQWTTQ